MQSRPSISRTVKIRWKMHVGLQACFVSTWHSTGNLQMFHMNPVYIRRATGQKLRPQYSVLAVELWRGKRKEERTNTKVGIPQSMLAASHWFVILGVKLHSSGGGIKASFGQGSRRNAWKLTARHIRKELHGRSTGRGSPAWTLMFLPGGRMQS